ncbi:MAG: MFS transporter [Mycobacterium leprae]
MNPRWRRDLYILWVCNFVLQAGFSLIMPFLPLYLEELGVHGSAVDVWSGVIFSANFIMMAIFSPIWGGLSDRIGRKPMMLRSAFGMGAVVWLMGIAHSPWQLLVIRLLQGFTSGFVPATTAYMASAAPRENSGYALGLMTTGSVAGTVLGPLIGGVLANAIGYRPIFFLTSATSLLTGAVVLFLIREQFTPVAKQKGDGVLKDIGLLRVYPVTAMMAVVLFLNTFSVLTAEPILSLYLQTLSAPVAWISFLSGLTFSITGVANLVVAPLVGRLSDKMGSRQLIMICLGGAAVMYVAQGFATATWQMVAMRFILGMFSGGLMPAANGLIARSTPKEVQGRIFGLTNSMLFIGNTLGPLVGGAIAAYFGLRSVFPVTGILLLVDLLWVRASVRDPEPLANTAD